MLSVAHNLGVAAPWKGLGFGRPTGRSTSYTTDQRLAAVVVGLACGLRGVAPGNLLLRRPRAKLREALLHKKLTSEDKSVQSLLAV